MKRLALYVFWEKDGIVRDYVAYYLQALKSVAQDITVIVNGSLSPEGRTRLEKLGIDILVRNNEGLDFGAWKHALLHRGWENIHGYDELVLCNCTCYGPVYPFSEMFSIMSRRVCDFWGINRQPDLPGKFLGPEQHRFPVREHIQSFFLNT